MIDLQELKNREKGRYEVLVPGYKGLLGLLPLTTLLLIKEAKTLTEKMWADGKFEVENAQYFDGGSSCSCYCGFALRCAVGTERGNGPITPAELREWQNQRGNVLTGATDTAEELDKRYGGGIEAWKDLYWSAASYKEVYIGAALEEILAEHKPTAFEEQIATREPDYEGAYQTFRGVIAFWPPEWIESRDHFNKLLDALLDTALPGWQGIEDETL